MYGKGAKYRILYTYTSCTVDTINDFLFYDNIIIIWRLGKVKILLYLGWKLKVGNSGGGWTCDDGKVMGFEWLQREASCVPGGEIVN